MDHLTDTTIPELQNALESVESKTPTLRLVAAIAYKNGITQSELADWFDVERKTIYNWLTRLDDRDLELAVRDKDRSGRPRKLSGDQFAELESILQTPPSQVGYESPAWTTELLQRCIQEKFEINYSLPSCRRLMKEAGLSHLPPQEAATEINQADIEAVEEELEDLGHIWLPTN